MENKPLSSYQDIELAEILSGQYQQLIIVQQNLQAIQNELSVRKNKPKVKV